jgi:hypothetical protein
MQYFFSSAWKKPQYKTNHQDTKEMTNKEVLSNLCYWDERNPVGVTSQENEGKRTKQCFCDNCFYGRTKLAEYILELLIKLKSK